MVPSSRLLFWTGVVVLPFGALPAALPSTAALALAVLGGFVLLAVLDALVSRSRLEMVELGGPAVVRLARFQEGAIPLHLRQKGSALAGLRLGLLWPAGFDSPVEDLRVSLPGEDRLFEARWPCTATRRGRHALRFAALETASWLGFWNIRRRMSLNIEVRVYPDLRAERRRVAASFLNRGHLGLHTWRQMGKGREFEQLREYLPGDNYEDIHWKATAKRRYPVTKMFQIERTQEVYVLVDASRLSARTSGEEAGQPGLTLLDRFITSALLLGHAADRQGDRYGLMTFSARPELFFPAGHGKAHFEACREALHALEPRPVSPDYAEVFSWVRTRLRKRALLMVLTSLDDPLLAEQFAQAVRLVCRQHLVLVNMLRPPRAAGLFEGGPPADVEEVYQRLGGHYLWRKLHETGRGLQRHGVRFAQLEHESLSAALITQYMNMKRRQVL